MPDRSNNSKIRYAVVGLGHIAQAAVLPAFRNARRAELVGLVSGDVEKAKAVAAQYGDVPVWTYEDYPDCLGQHGVDAVYIALPNDKHRDFAVAAAHARVNVLCEKPMAVTSEECSDIIDACLENNVKLMVAYRLHFESANLNAIEIAQSGKLGDLRLFTSVFSMQVRPDNIRLSAERGGGSVYDIGIYCINAARYIFQDEPSEVVACEGTNGDARFQSVDEMMSVILRFPNHRTATFTCSFNGPGLQYYTVMGSRGSLRVEPAYDYAGELQHHLTIGEQTQTKTFPQSDQFGPELEYFADCILQNRDPEPDGWEGRQDVQIIEAIYKSAKCGVPVKIQAFQRNKERANLSLERRKPPVEEPALVGVQPPTIDE